MAEYVGLLAAAVLLGMPLCSKKAGKWGKAAYCIIMALMFIFVSASRFEVGYDFNSYGRIYFNMKYMDPEDVMAIKTEKGFSMPLYILNLGYEEYYNVFIYTSIIIYGTVFYLIWKNSSCPWISVGFYLCLGLYFNSLCFLRQVIAALIIGYAVRYITVGKPLRFFAFAMVAATFHWSALIMIPIYFLAKIKPSRIYLGVMAALTTAFCIVSKPLMFWVIDHFPMYSGYDPETNVEAVTGLSPKYTIMFGIFFLTAFLLRKRLAEKNPDNNIYINLMMFTVIFEATGMRHAILSRFAIIPYIAPILYLAPDIAACIKDLIKEKFADPKRRGAAETAAVAVTLAYTAGCYLMLMYGNYNGVVPYTSQWNRPYDIFVESVITEEDEELDISDPGIFDEEGDIEEDMQYETAENTDEEFDEDGGYMDYSEEELNDEILSMLG